MENYGRSGGRGAITLPVEVRERNGINVGDRYGLIDLDGVLVLTPVVDLVSELAHEIEQARLEAGLSTDDLLRTLLDERERYVSEHRDGV